MAADQQICAQCGTASGVLLYVAHGGGDSGWFHRECIEHWRVERDRAWYAARALPEGGR
jgi:hypothetical protein